MYEIAGAVLHYMIWNFLHFVTVYEKNSLVPYQVESDSDQKKIRTAEPASFVLSKKEVLFFKAWECLSGHEKKRCGSMQFKNGCLIFFHNRLSLDKFPLEISLFGALGRKLRVTDTISSANDVIY